LGQIHPVGKLEIELIQTQMAQKPVLREDVYTRVLRASQNLKKVLVWMDAKWLSDDTVHLPKGKVQT
jgi:hypothetical protein